MRFVDEAVIEVVAGHGGAGSVHFRRESKVPMGGPDGGDGGRGGDVTLVADERSATLMDHRYRRHYHAEDGADGAGAQKTGHDGQSLEIPVPVGTVVTDATTGEVLADLTEAGQRVVVATGGRGGRGNTFFASSTRQAPRHAQPGEAGDERSLNLSLKLVADIGLVGLPNAGKSTFIRAVSRSQAKVGAYPFTTLVPNLGVARIDGRELVVADIPGLVEGAHEGHGLGDRFLKHLERTRALVHLVSLSPDAPDPVEAYDTVQHELAAHSAELASRPQVVVLNKIDLLDDPYEIELWSEAFAERGVTVMSASGLAGDGVLEVLRCVVGLLGGPPQAEQTPPEPWSPV
ncbi:MAG: GTPase ObgE [Deltaproteobacteria bacterium]|nr:GTPase ObgE [Deltaproteobacteria bacterium]MCB9785562.1 GTPase ObgE [Deltaproteobacteria bacterium]